MVICIYYYSKYCSTNIEMTNGSSVNRGHCQVMVGVIFKTVLYLTPNIPKKEPYVGDQ
jgi:hypothetical protein